MSQYSNKNVKPSSEFSCTKFLWLIEFSFTKTTKFQCRKNFLTIQHSNDPTCQYKKKMVGPFGVLYSTKHSRDNTFVV